MIDFIFEHEKDINMVVEGTFKDYEKIKITYEGSSIIIKNYGNEYLNEHYSIAKYLEDIGRINVIPFDKEKSSIYYKKFKELQNIKTRDSDNDYVADEINKIRHLYGDNLIEEATATYEDGISLKNKHFWEEKLNDIEEQLELIFEDDYCDFISNATRYSVIDNFVTSDEQHDTILLLYASYMVALNKRNLIFNENKISELFCLNNDVKKYLTSSHIEELKIVKGSKIIEDKFSHQVNKFVDLVKKEFDSEKDLNDFVKIWKSSNPEFFDVFTEDSIGFVDDSFSYNYYDISLDFKVSKDSLDYMSLVAENLGEPYTFLSEKIEKTLSKKRVKKFTY